MRTSHLEHAQHPELSVQNPKKTLFDLVSALTIGGAAFAFEPVREAAQSAANYTLETAVSHPWLTTGAMMVGGFGLLAGLNSTFRDNSIYTAKYFGESIVDVALSSARTGFGVIQDFWHLLSNSFGYAAQYALQTAAYYGTAALNEGLVRIVPQWALDEEIPNPPISQRHSNIHRVYRTEYREIFRKFKQRFDNNPTFTHPRNNPDKPEGLINTCINRAINNIYNIGGTALSLFAPLVRRRVEVPRQPVSYV